MKAFVAIAIAAAVLLGATPASAEEGRDRGERALKRVDLNGDGIISREEARLASDRRFLTWDRNGDSAVTEAEMLAAVQERLTRRIRKMFARIDGNGDGRIDRAEFDVRGQARFDRMDADGDGSIQIEEIRARWHGRRHGDKGEVRPEN